MNHCQAIVLAKDTIDTNDIDSLIDWLKTYPKLTKGELTILFEKEWARIVGAEYAVFVNSGSSANLISIFTLLEGGRLKNKKVVVPALSWITDISPVMQAGLVPILCDCNKNDLSVDLEHLEKIFRQEEPALLILVSVLGLVPEMQNVKDLCDKYGVLLFVDNCESFGSKYSGISLEKYGIMASCSTYYGHIISTIEGGIVTTNDYELYCLLKMLRSHGWDRDLDDERKKTLRKDNQVDEFNALYTFYTPGFNLRATDLQAQIGIGQLGKLKDIVARRNNNYNLFNELITNDFWKPVVSENRFVSNLGYPVIHIRREEIVKEMAEQNIEVRPLISGSIGLQPFYIKKYGKCDLPNAGLVSKFGFYLPNHPFLTFGDIERMAKIINKYK